jgi:hypothetical protein
MNYKCPEHYSLCETLLYICLARTDIVCSEHNAFLEVACILSFSLLSFEFALLMDLGNWRIAFLRPLLS